ncbi:hypothetical protein ACOMHN_048606 [Nucella lapillus]
MASLWYLNKYERYLNKYERYLNKYERYLNKYERYLNKYERYLNKYERYLNKYERYLNKYERYLNKYERYLNKYERYLNKYERIMEHHSSSSASLAQQQLTNYCHRILERQLLDILRPELLDLLRFANGVPPPEELALLSETGDDKLACRETGGPFDLQSNSKSLVLAEETPVYLSSLQNSLEKLTPLLPGPEPWRPGRL